MPRFPPIAPVCAASDSQSVRRPTQLQCIKWEKSAPAYVTEPTREPILIMLIFHTAHWDQSADLYQDFHRVDLEGRRRGRQESRSELFPQFDNADIRAAQEVKWTS
jgi:hypothetical protein